MGRKRKRRNGISVEALQGPARPKSVEDVFIDASTLHLGLEVADLVPQGQDAQIIQAVLLHGFLRLGKDGAFAGWNGISKDTLWKAVRAKIGRGRHPNDARRAVEKALAWLVREGAVLAPSESNTGYSLGKSASASGVGLALYDRAIKYKKDVTNT